MTPFLPSRSVARSHGGGARSERQLASQHRTNTRTAVRDDSEQTTNRVNGGNRAHGPRRIGGSRNSSNKGHKSRNENGAASHGRRGHGKNECRPRSSNNSGSLPIAAGPSPFGVGLTNQDRAGAVLRWNLTPGYIASEKAQARERNRALRLAREAHEEATGVKEPPPAEPSLAESFKRMDVPAEDGKTASRVMMGTATRWSNFSPKAVVSESNPI